MTRSAALPQHLMLFGAELPEDFPERIEGLRLATGLSREAFAHCLSVDPRQLRQWMRGTKPRGDGLFALFTMASRLPGGLELLLYGDERKGIAGRRTGLWVNTKP